MIELGDESMFEPVNEHLRYHDGNYRLWWRMVIFNSQLRRKRMDTDVGYRPKDVVSSEPAETLRQSETFAEGESITTELYQVTESDNEEHQGQGKTLDDVCVQNIEKKRDDVDGTRLTSTGDLEQAIFFELFENTSFDFDELIRNQQCE